MLQTAVRCSLLILAAGAVSAGGDEKPYWVGKTMPQLRAPREHWVNAEPPTRAELSGKLLWVQFTFLQ